jgi:ABC-2 type transport system ATP-binding protein
MIDSLVKMEEVTKMYTKDKGVKDISFAIDKGEIHGIIGSNGAGKTSIIKLLLNHIKSDKGTIRYNGNSLSNQKDFISFKRNVGYVPDDEILLENLSPIEIIEFVSQAYGFQKSKALENAHQLFNLLELDDLNSNVNFFSRGMKKKVQLVSALCTNPDLLILDEPIAGFDPKVIYLIKKLFRALRDSGKGIFISTHDLNIANELCDRVTMIHNGTVLVTGNKDTILSQYRVESLEELFISQTMNVNNEELVRHVVANM